MLKQTTLKLAGSLFGASLLGIILSVVIIFTFGGLGAKSATTSSSSAASSSTVSSQSSSESQTSSTASSTVSSSTSSTTTQYSTGGLIDTVPGKILLGGLSILLIFSMLYNSAWKEGNKDPNRIHYGHMKKFMAKGFVAGLIAIIPYIIYTTVFLIINAAMPNTITQVTIGAIYRALNMQFIVFGDGWLNYPVVCYLLLLIYPISSCVGYIAGYKGIVIWSRIIYKDNGKTSKRKQKYLNNLKK